MRKSNVHYDENAEIERIAQMSVYEKTWYAQNKAYIAGVDEAGRGPLAGPVVAASVILPQDCFIPGLDDSKKLSKSKREKLYDIITALAISYGVGIVSELEIDTINILNATKKAMQIALKALQPEPDVVLVDAVTIPDISFPQQAIIKGDQLSVSIAAASIIAKVTRDRMMLELDAKYPEYGFQKHMGYGTRDHIETIKKIGICPIHRMSFTKNFV